MVERERSKSDKDITESVAPMTSGFVRRTEIVIGREEKHAVTVEVSAWSGRTKVYVDGRIILNKLEFYSLGTKTEKFSVGERETHQIQLRISGVIFPSIELFVDRELGV